MQLRAIVLMLLVLACSGESPTSPGTPGAIDATLSGRAVTPEGAPAANVQVTIDGRRTVTATTAADGSFAFEPVPPGLHSLRVGTKSAGTTILLAGANAHDVVVSDCIVPFGTVRDRRTGRPIAGAKMTIWYGQATTDPNGNYRIDFGCAPLTGSSIPYKAEHPGYVTFESIGRVSFLCACSFDVLLDPK